MPYEEIEVRVTAQGHVYVDARGMEPERVRSVMEYLSETLGPGREIHIDPSESPPQTVNMEEANRERVRQALGLEREDEKERERLRLENGGA